MITKNLVKKGLFILISSFIISCSDDEGSKGTAKDSSGTDSSSISDTGAIKSSLEKRVMDRWDTIKGYDYGDTYKYLSPSQKTVIEKQSYVKNFGGLLEYTKIIVNSISCDAGKDLDKSKVCTVKLYVNYIYKKGKLPGGAALQEQWVKEDKQWWFYNK